MKRLLLTLALVFPIGVGVGWFADRAVKRVDSYLRGVVHDQMTNEWDELPEPPPDKILVPNNITVTVTGYRDADGKVVWNGAGNPIELEREAIARAGEMLVDIAKLEP